MQLGRRNLHHMVHMQIHQFHLFENYRFLLDKVFLELRLLDNSILLGKCNRLLLLGQSSDLSLRLGLILLRHSHK